MLSVSRSCYDDLGLRRTTRDLGHPLGSVLFSHGASPNQLVFGVAVHHLCRSLR